MTGALSYFSSMDQNGNKNPFRSIETLDLFSDLFRDWSDCINYWLIFAGLNFESPGCIDFGNN